MEVPEDLQLLRPVAVTWRPLVPVFVSRQVPQMVWPVVPCRGGPVSWVEVPWAEGVWAPVDTEVPPVLQVPWGRLLRRRLAPVP